MKSGILLAAFGSGSNQGESALRHFTSQVRERFPDVAVRWAFTSELMRERLASARKKSDSVGKALDKMAFERFTHVAVQPLHVISGLEYNDIAADVEQLRQRFTALALGVPLLGDFESSPAASGRDFIEPVAQAMLATLPEERRSDEAVLFMGHGTRHPAEKLYESLSAAVQHHDPLVFMGTLNGTLRLEHILPHVREVRRAWLMPFFSVVGRHTLEDMAGTSACSWLSRLQAENISCTPVLKGMLEQQAFVTIWIDHLARSMSDWA